MSSSLALIIIFAVFTAGEIVSVKSRAYVSMILFCFFGFMVLFWCGLPKGVFTDSGMIAFRDVTLGMLLAHIGTTIDLRDFAKEWKTVVLVLCSTVGIAAGAYFVGGLLVPREWAIAGAPVLSGAMAAYIIMGEQMAAVLGDAGSTPMVFALLVLVFQFLFGVPIASCFLKREGLRIRAGLRDGSVTAAAEEAQTEAVRMWLRLPEKYNTPYFTLLKLAVIAYIGFLLGSITGISQMIFDMILGAVAKGLGLIENAPLENAGSFTLIMVASLCGVFGNIANTTPKELLSMLLPLLGFMAVGIIIGCLTAILIGRLFALSREMSICLAVTALFGFPATYQISHEIALSVGDTPEEAAAIESVIAPKMILAGIVSVSIVSGLIAGLMATWL